MTLGRLQEGMLYLFAALDRPGNFTYAERHERMTKAIAADSLRHQRAAVPYKSPMVLTKNGIQFTQK